MLSRSHLHELDPDQIEQEVYWAVRERLDPTVSVKARIAYDRSVWIDEVNNSR